MIDLGKCLLHPLNMATTTSTILTKTNCTRKQSYKQLHNFMGIAIHAESMGQWVILLQNGADDVHATHMTCRPVNVTKSNTNAKLQ